MTPLAKKLVWIAALLMVVMVGAEQYRKMTAPKVGNFSGKTMKGESFNLAEYRGKKPVLFSFYATWCGPCQMEVDHLVKLTHEYEGKGLQVVVLTEEPPEVIEGHSVMSGAPFRIIPNAGDIFKQFGVTSIPRSFLLKPNGEVFELQGYSDDSMKSLEDEVKSAVKLASAQP